MKTLVLQPMLHDAHHFTADAKRRCAYGESWRIFHPSIYGERLDGKTVGSLEDSRRLCKSQLVNKWLALKRRTASLPVVCSPTLSSGGPSSDANGNCKVKRFRHQDRVTDPLQLPIDPRSWSTNDVRTWLGHMTKSHDLEVDPSFFQMNGRGLCLMPLKGFLFRVPDHGKLLYEDFRGRLRQCLLAPGNDTRPKTEQGAGTKSSREAASPSGQARKHRRAVVSYQGVVVVGKSSVTDCKGQMSPTTYHTL